jgi:hypothetical protein
VFKFNMGAKFSSPRSEGKRTAENTSGLRLGLQIFEGFLAGRGKTDTTTGWSNEAPPKQKAKLK